MRTGTAPPPTGGGFSPVAPFVQPGAPKARRQPALLALGVALIGMSAAGFVYWNQKAQATSAVLVLARDVPYGQHLAAADLKVVRMAVPDGVKAIGSASQGTVLTEVATTQLHAGAILTAADIAAAPPIPDGTDLVSFSLKPDMLPAGIAPGRQVLLIANKVWPFAIFSGGAAAANDLKTPPDSVIPANPPTYKATVVTVAGAKLTLAVQQGDAVVVEELGNDGRFGLALLPAGS